MPEKPPDGEETMRLGEAIFEREVRDAVRGEDDRSFVAIDVQSEDFEVDSDDRAAVHRLRDRHPEARVWLRRVGLPYTRKFGARPRNRDTDS